MTTPIITPTALELQYPAEYARYWFLECWSDTSIQIEREEADWSQWNSENHWDENELFWQTPWPGIANLNKLKAQLKAETEEFVQLHELLYPEDLTLGVW